MYAVVFLDAIHFKVKQDGAIVNKAACMVLASTWRSIRMCSACRLEKMKFWLSVLNDLKNRGVQDILINLHR
ncbi:transposase [Paenibacillus sp. S-12]|uniref:transposase n=1 Tax=Paenibacillus sp. S-12 TaxID=3031371 RepID=UPI00338D9E3C